MSDNNNSDQLDNLNSDLLNQKKNVDQMLNDIKDLLNKLKFLEDQIKNNENDEKNKNSDLSNKYKELSDNANKRMTNLEDDLAKLEALLDNLSGQMTALATLNSEQGSKCKTPVQITPGPDPETIRNLMDMKSRLGRLEPRVDELENNKNDDFDQDALKLQILNEMPSIIDQYWGGQGSQTRNAESYFLNYLPRLEEISLTPPLFKRYS